MAHRRCSAAHSAATRRCKSSAVALGGDYARLRSESLLAGEGAESDLSRSTSATATRCSTSAPCRITPRRARSSDLLFKGAVEDTARVGVLRPHPHLRQAAQKAEAYQTNRNLVLTEGASAESIPNLEIEANDVQCSPRVAPSARSTTTSCYYLETPRRPARGGERLIVLGFFDDVFDRLPVPSLVAPLRRTSSRRSSTGGRGAGEQRA